MLVGGESLTTQTVESVMPQATAIYNVYGPTECSVECTVHSTNPSKPHEIARIGRPIWNVHLYGVVVGGDSSFDGSPTLAPIGESCELWVGGVGVARGYHNRPDLNQKSFLPNPFGQGGRVYRTGDLVRWTESGILEHLGRIDSQVKLRGYRIELGEVEAVASGTIGVKQCAVLLKHGPDGQDHLVAYVTPPVERTLVLAHCSSSLARYMIPNIVVGLQTFPIAAGGKVDRRALPEPDWSSYNILSRARVRRTSKDLYLRVRRQSKELLERFTNTQGDSTVGPKQLALQDSEGLERPVQPPASTNSGDEDFQEGEWVAEAEAAPKAVAAAAAVVLVEVERAAEAVAAAEVAALAAGDGEAEVMSCSGRILDAVCQMSGANRAEVYGHSNFFSEL